ncbi:hypothetical protein [Clostridium brassicae]|uniref:Phage gp6-like head-tail connector protein n=1 Tax=Clostridium brassicae TaxID=2999072 RepID=A0ABT4D977_9CLOT|nr:hypothetical protein [Clostridium brassicae]MCY6958862.1 hypothetical protein [Clostridium brassicae]
MDLNSENKFTDEEYEEIACTSIRNYLNKDMSNDYIKKNYGLAVKRMICKAKETQEAKPTGIKSIVEGDTSISYDDTIDNLIVDCEIKALLPQPYIKMY